MREITRKLKSPISWVGGKSKLVKRIQYLIPEHKDYIEVFGGAASLLFAKEPAVRLEVLNDYDADLMNMWHIIKHEKDKFIRSFEYVFVSRTTFNKYKEKLKKRDFIDDMERAHIFYYLVKSAFGSEVRSPSFGTSKAARNRLHIEDIERDIEAASARLKKVTVENNDFEKIIKIYDDKDAFLFLDPPYRRKNFYNVKQFTDEDYIRLHEAVLTVKGKWLLTINDDEFIRTLFKDFYILQHKVFYGISRDIEARGKYGELIVINYPLEEEKISMFYE